MHLIPQRNFTVVRQIADHTDVTTYYVRAVIRNAYTDVILATLDLEDKTGQRFKKDWQVPADSSGEGFFVSIVTSVYTDSGYTTKSSDYGDEENSYLVINTPSSNHTGGGIGMGGGLARRDIRDIVQEELEKFLVKLEEMKPEPIDIPKYEMRWEDILKAISKLETKIGGIKLEGQKIDLGPITKGITEIKKEIKDIEIPKATDLEPVMKKISDGFTAIDKSDKSKLESVLRSLSGEFSNAAGRHFIKLMGRVNFIPTQKLVFANPEEYGEDERGKKEEEKPLFEKEVNIDELSS